MRDVAGSLWMVLASLFFACMGVCVKFAAVFFSAGEIVFYRAFFSLLLIFALVRWRGVALATPYWRWQLNRGTAGFLALSCYFLAITLLPLATAVTLNYTSSIFLALILALRGNRPNFLVLLALAVGLIGVAWLLKPSLQEDQWLGALAGLASGVLAGLAYFSVRELGTRGEPESRTVFYFSLVSTLGAAVWMGFQERHALDWQGFTLMLGVAGFATLGQLAMTRAYARGQTLAAAALAYTAVVFASLFGVLFFNETLDSGAGLAMLLIVLSGIATTHFSRATPTESD